MQDQPGSTGKILKDLILEELNDKSSDDDNDLELREVISSNPSQQSQPITNIQLFDRYSTLIKSLKYCGLVVLGFVLLLIGYAGLAKEKSILAAFEYIGGPSLATDLSIATFSLGGFLLFGTLTKLLIDACCPIKDCFPKAPLKPGLGGNSLEPTPSSEETSYSVVIEPYNPISSVSPIEGLKMAAEAPQPVL